MSENEIMVVDNPSTTQSVSLIKNSETIDAENKQGLIIIKKILDTKQDAVVINGKRHIEYEDWQALGNAYGVDVATGDIEPIEYFGVKGFKAKAKVIRIEDGIVIGGAEALCMENEHNWKNKDYFQMASMAQTRAGSKALSNILRFVVALDKSLSGTPAEEMEGVSGSKKSNGKKTKKRKKVAPEPTIETQAEVSEVTEVVEAELVTNDEAPEKKKKKTLKELKEEYAGINTAIDNLQSNKKKVSRENVVTEILALYEKGEITLDEYRSCKSELVN